MARRTADFGPDRRFTMTRPTESATHPGFRLYRRTPGAIEHERLRDPSEKAIKGDKHAIWENCHCLGSSGMATKEVW